MSVELFLPKNKNSSHIQHLRHSRIRGDDVWLTIPLLIAQIVNMSQEFNLQTWYPKHQEFFIMNTLMHFMQKHIRTLLTPFILLAVIGLTGCQSNEPQAEAPKSHPITGVVLSIDKEKGLITVDHEAVPGEMEAMKMPFSPADPAELSKLHEGDKITADYSVQANGAVLDNIKVLKK